MNWRTRGRPLLRNCCPANPRSPGRTGGCCRPPDYGSRAAEEMLRGYVPVWMMWYTEERCMNGVTRRGRLTTGVSETQRNRHPSSVLKKVSITKIDVNERSGRGGRST